MELFILSQDEQPLTVLSENTGLVKTYYRIEMNNVPTEPFSFAVEANNPVAKYVKEENKVVFKDHEGDWRLMTIKEVDDSNGINEPITIANCFPTFLSELNDHIVVERRFIEQTADVALTAAVDGTRWIGKVEVELGRATTNFYYISSTEAIEETLNTWGGEFKDVVELEEETNQIKGCYVKIIQRLGTEQGQRFEIDHNTTEIGRTVLSYPKTALYGRGASLEVEDDDGNHTGGYTRYIDFSDVEWKKSNGDPVDKPKGQKWVGDPEALKVYGYEGKTKHRFGLFSNQDYEEPADLLQATWEALQNAKKPEVNYKLSVELFNEKVSLGDTCQAIDRMFARPIEIQARVIAMEYDLMDVEGTMVVEMGQFLDLGENRIDDLEKEVEEIKRNPPKIGEGSYPNIKPGTPVNVEAYGGMEVIQLYWDYASQIYVKHYEVYGSRTEDFVPDSQHLLWRGNTSAFAHTVGTDEVWYYRIRAVNYHGTPSDWSVQVRAATHRVISDDILFDPELAERMRELSEIAQTIADGTINFDHLDGTIINGNRIKGDLIAIDGTTYIQEGVIGTAAIADAAIDRAKLGTAVVGTAQIENGAITNAKIANLNADKINAGALRGIDIWGAKFRSSSGNNWMEIVGGDIHLEQSNGRYMNLGPSGLYGYNAGGDIRFQADSILVTSAALGTSNYNVYLATSSTNEARVVDIRDVPSDGEISSYRYRPLRADGFYGNFIENNAGSAGNNLYLRPRAGGEVRITGAGTTDAYYNLRVGNIYSNGIITRTDSMWMGVDSGLHVVNKSYAWGGGGDPVYRNIHGANIYNTAMITRTANAYIGADNELRVVNKGLGSVYRDIRALGFIGNRVTLGTHINGTHFHVQPAANGEVRITSRAGTGSYRPIRAEDYLPPSSTRESKKHIEVFNDNTLNTFRDTNVYHFLYNWQDENEKLRLGIMLDEAPNSIVAPTGDTLEMYSTIGFLWKGLKDTITYLDEETNWQRMEYQYLNNEVIKINDEISRIKKENKELKERVQQLEEMVA